MLLLIIIILFGGILCMMDGDNSSTVSPVSAEVEAYEPLIRQYANQYGIGEYVNFQPYWSKIIFAEMFVHILTTLF